MIAARKAKRIVIAVIGGTVLLFGIALLVLPGPAFIVIPAGLAILASEFAWARLWLRKAKGMFQRGKKGGQSGQQSQSSGGGSDSRHEPARKEASNQVTK